MRVKGLTAPQITELLANACRRVCVDDMTVFICVADHYEPDWGHANETLRRERVLRWLSDYPKSIAGIRDSRGQVPQHCFFYPMEEYCPQLLDDLAKLCHAGFGDVEIHLHHDNDTAENLTESMLGYKETLYHRHGLLRRDEDGEIVYGFIHGNWALCNGRADGRWCGVNDELTVLKQTGCYADFTFPSAPDNTQTPSMNRIYYARSTPERPCGHHHGPVCSVGREPPEDHLLMVPGPLALDLGQRKLGMVPRVENGDLHADRPPSARRIPLWLSAGVSMDGNPNWKFIKLHTHGAKESNANQLLGEPMRRLHQGFADYSKRHSGFRYYYVTAWEMACLIHAAESGCREPELALAELVA